MVNKLTSNDIIIYRGNDATYKLTVKKSDGSAYDLTGCTLKLYVKRKVEELDADAIIEKLSSDATEINITDATGGIAEIYFVPADTSSLEYNKQYVYDVELETPAPVKKYTILRAVFKLKQN